MFSAFASRLARLRELSPSHRRLLLQSSALLPVFWLGLRILGLPQMHAFTQRRPLSPGLLTPDEIRRIAGTIDKAARHSPFPQTCLTRSLLLQWLLRGRGVRSELRIGTRRAAGNFEAHAWIECDGTPMNEVSDVITHFDAFDRLEPGVRPQSVNTDRA